MLNRGSCGSPNRATCRNPGCERHTSCSKSRSQKVFLETIFEKGYILNRLDWMSEIAISWNKIGFSLYRVGEAVAMLSLCLCASVVLLEMPAIIILAVTDFNHRGTEQIRDQMESNHSLVQH